MKITENIELLNCDCMEYMRTLPDNAFDLAICDPPYGIGIAGQKKCVCKNSKHNRKYHENMGWDELPPPESYFRELERVSRNQIIWGGNYFVPYLKNGTKGWICWFKGQTGLTMSDCELAYSSFNCPTRVVKINRCALAKQGTIHPTEKPIQLYGWLLNNYAKDGDKILDTHFGSCSIGIACHNLGFSLTACEINETYFKKAVERLKQHVRQQKLF